MIFKRIKRTNSEYPGNKEPIFDYLNRSSSKEAENVRKTINKWFSYYPKNEEPEFLSRIQSNEDQEFLSAFSELYIHELGRQLGYQITIHPQLDNDVEKKPDFLFNLSKEEVYVESIVTNELSIDERRREKDLNVLLDSINKIKSENYFISVKPIGMPTKPISSKKFISDLQVWLDSLNYDEVEQIYSMQNGNPISREFLLDEMKIKISVIPKYKNKGKIERIIGTQISEVKLIKTKNVIRKAIKKKVTRYGEINKPYILVINVQSISCDTTDVMEALFGTEKYIYRFIENKTLPPIVTRDGDGKISPTINTRLSGIMIFDNLKPWNFHVKKPVLYLNPWAKNPYNGKLLDLPHYFPENGIMNFNTGKDFHII